MSVAEAVMAAGIVGAAAVTRGLDRKIFLTETDVHTTPESVLWLDSVREAASRAFSRQHIRKRRQMAGQPIWQDPFRRAELLKADIGKGPLFEQAQRVAGGVRLSIYEDTGYGKVQEAARQSDTPHDWDHERRLFDLAEAIFTQPEVELHNKALYNVPTLWIPTHDAAQSIREHKKIPNAKWGHDYLALLQALTQRNRVMKEAGISEDTARLVTGANAVIMLYHDEPRIQSKILDAVEKDGSLMPYEDKPIYEDQSYGIGNIVRKYMTPEELMANLDDPTSEKVDITAVPDWLMAQTIRLRLSKKGFVNLEDPLSFGFDPSFERDFHNELEQLARMPEGEGFTEDLPGGHVLLYTPEQIGAAEERALIPSRLLDPQTRLEIAFIGDAMRTVDVFDMIPPIGVVRKLEVPMNWDRPVYRPGALESIVSDNGTVDAKATIDAEEDSIWRRTLFELHAAIIQIQGRPGQLRQRIDSIRYARDTAYTLLDLGADALARTMPIFMSGDLTKTEGELTRILMEEHDRIAKKVRASRSLNRSQKADWINQHLAGVKIQVERIMGNMGEQFSKTYEPEQIEDVANTVTRLKTFADKMYHSLYNDRRTRPGRPYRTWESTSGADLSKIRAVRRHSSHDRRIEPPVDGPLRQEPTADELVPA